MYDSMPGDCPDRPPLPTPDLSRLVGRVLAGSWSRTAAGAIPSAASQRPREPKANRRLEPALKRAHTPDAPRRGRARPSTGYGCRTCTQNLPLLSTVPIGRGRHAVPGRMCAAVANELEGTTCRCACGAPAGPVSSRAGRAGWVMRIAPAGRRRSCWTRSRNRHRDRGEAAAPGLDALVTASMARRAACRSPLRAGSGVGSTSSRTSSTASN